MNPRKFEPAIWSRGTGQRTPCFQRCPLIVQWMSNIKEVPGKRRLDPLFEVWPSHFGLLNRHRA